MRPNRRTILKGLGGVGLGGAGVAYWQRRWIRRRDDFDAIETVLDAAVPTVPDPVTVTDAHIDAAYSWAREHVETTESELPESERKDSTRLENAKESLAGRAPDEVDDGADRHAALADYKIGVSSSAIARGRHVETTDGSPSDELQAAHETLGDELDAFDPPYAGETLNRTVVQTGHAESLGATAESSHSRAARFMAGDEYSNAGAWGTVETARFELYSAEWFGEAHATDDAVDRTAALEDRSDRLDERIESATDGVAWEYEPDVYSQANDRWSLQSDLRGQSTLAEEADRLAWNVSIQAELATVAETLVEFDDVPASRDLEDVDVELLDDASELVAEKRTATERLATTADAVGSDPLGAHLLRQAIQNVEQADSALGRLREDVNSYDGSAWQAELDRAALRYRGAAADADAIPAIVDLVADGA